MIMMLAILLIASSSNMETRSHFKEQIQVLLLEVFKYMKADKLLFLALQMKYYQKFHLSTKVTLGTYHMLNLTILTA